MANPYYRSGEVLKVEERAGGGRSGRRPRVRVGAIVPRSGVRTALDVGCGWGRFARPLAARGSIDLTCMDVSAGMVESCCRRPPTRRSRLISSWATPCAIPVIGASFDLVMANHMLYEFDSDDLRQVIAELRRVVAPEGTLLATTYSDAETVPLTDLHNQTLAALGFAPPGPPQPSSFSLENGAAVLRAEFAQVATYVMEEVRSDTDAAELTALYLRTGGYPAQERIDRQGDRDGHEVDCLRSSRVDLTAPAVAGPIGGARVLVMSGLGPTLASIRSWAGPKGVTARLVLASDLRPVCWPRPLRVGL